MSDFLVARARNMSFVAIVFSDELYARHAALTYGRTASQSTGRCWSTAPGATSFALPKQMYLQPLVRVRKCAAALPARQTVAAGPHVLALLRSRHRTLVAVFFR